MKADGEGLFFVCWLDRTWLFTRPCKEAREIVQRPGAPSRRAGGHIVLSMRLFCWFLDLSPY